MASLLIEPVQRLPRYTLLLQELLKRSQGLRGTRAYLQLRQAKEKMQETTHRINAGKRQKADIEYASYLCQLFIFEHRRHKSVCLSLSCFSLSLSLSLFLTSLSLVPSSF